MNDTIHLDPLVKWSGGKKDELKYILEHIPTSFNTYLEPFIGGGVVFFLFTSKKSSD